MTVELRKEGAVTKVYQNNQFYGEYQPCNDGFQWRNLLADKLKNPNTTGVVKSERAALLKLGFKQR